MDQAHLEIALVHKQKENITKAYARKLFSDLFGPSIAAVGQFLDHLNHHRLAKLLTWA